MNTWPHTWIAQALDAIGVPPTSNAILVMRAWKNSTPLPPYSNNPVGMPAGSSGASKYMGTRYAAFPTMTSFYVAFGKWSKSHDGKSFIRAIQSEKPYPVTWRVISSLKWPGSDTETDYPSRLLDLTEQSYRDSVEASEPSARKTSGIVGVSHDATRAMVEQVRSLHHAAQTFSDATKATQYMIRRHARNA